MKRNHNETSIELCSKVVKVEDDVESLVLEEVEDDVESLVLEVEEKVKFKLNCECAVPCAELVVKVKRDSEYRMGLELIDNETSYRTVFRRNYAQLLRLVLSLNLPIGETLLKVYVEMC
ncbi:ORF78 [Betabaculovirus altermyunipunctae]|uniref:ORF78 n=1 Tax=Betabaculovirus altermyunipunctae TaxID=3051996 RepID=A0A1S5YE64_9BBAC|nr:ORF78 [Betabaculovirus altermyunipunctae]AQQ80345.1 ORF78 [Betabaculovirus altermyunipunctae]